jgi:hypothetical protein
MTTSASSHRHFSVWLRGHAIAASLTVLLCAAFPRVLIAWRADPEHLVRTYSDAGTYLAPARSFIERGAFRNSAGEPDVHRRPGYPLFLTAIMSLVGRDLRLVLTVQAIILSCQVLALYWLARRVCHRRRRS